MIPGSVSKMTESTVPSAATINPKTDIVNVTVSTQINTINPALGSAQSQFLVLVPKDGAITLGTSGNIAVGLAAVVDRAIFMVFVRSRGKWMINSGV
jgi:hypothetical protein